MEHGREGRARRSMPSGAAKLAKRDFRVIFRQLSRITRRLRAGETLVVRDSVPPAPKPVLYSPAGALPRPPLYKPVDSG